MSLVSADTALVSDVFVTVGQPTVTYVKRNDGRYEGAIIRALEERGQICLITGPSKTGKTTLYKNVLTGRGELPLIIRCSKKLTCNEIWRQALEKIDFQRAISRSSIRNRSISSEAEIGVEGGWAFLAKISPKIRRVAGSTNSETEIIERIISEPSADLLVDAINNLNYVLVIEDFHYLSDDVKTELFQQWKQFTDEGITVIVVETSHRAVDIANSNKDLIGRVSHIDCQDWSLSDLQKICTLGFAELKNPVHTDISEFISREAVGLPIVAQQVCLELLEQDGIKTVEEARKKRIKFSKERTKRAFHAVALSRYKIFDSYYATIIKGPREKARKYSTYEIVIACFTVDPLKFSLSKSEILERIEKLQIAASQIPPNASINSTLGALAKFQEKRDIELLEWRATEGVLHILEPTFLFYVRWRSLKAEISKQLDFLNLLELFATEVSPDVSIKAKFGRSV